MERIARLERHEGAQIGVDRARIADFQRAHRLDECRKKCVVHGVVHQKPLGRDARLAAVLAPRERRRTRHRRHVHIVPDQKRVTAAKLQHHGLQGGACRGSDGSAGAFTAGERDGGDARIGNDARRRIVRHEQHLQQAIQPARVLQCSLQGQRAPRHVLGKLQHHRVPDQQCRCNHAHHLPVRKVPRHDGKQHAERIMADLVTRQRSGQRVEQRCMIRVPLAAHGTLLHLAAGCGDRLAHLHGRGGREDVDVRAQRHCDAAKVVGACSTRHTAPRTLRIMGAGQAQVDFVCIMHAVGDECLAAMRIRAHQGHGHRSVRATAHAGVRCARGEAYPQHPPLVPDTGRTTSPL